MAKNRVFFTEQQLEFLIASSNSEFRGLHADDAKESIVQQLRDLADRMQDECEVSIEPTRSGVYRVRLAFPKRTRRPFLAPTRAYFPGPARDVTDEYLEGHS